MTGTFQVQKIDDHTIRVAVSGPNGDVVLLLDAGTWSQALATQNQVLGKAR